VDLRLFVGLVKLSLIFHTMIRWPVPYCSFLGKKLEPFYFGRKVKKKHKGKVISCIF
jgi:hypothetical protein